MRSKALFGLLVAGVALSMACGGQGATEPAGHAAQAPVPTVSARAGAPPEAPAASGSVADRRCGALECRRFDTALQAFEAVLADKPLVVAVGESHAPKGAEGVPSCVSRFTTELLPALEGRASDVLVELMAPPPGCKAKTEQVRTKQKVVTEQQASTNQGEYVALGNEAKRRGVVPDLLRPSCADLEAIDRAGDEAIVQSLTTIARLTKGKVSELVDRNAKLGQEKVVVTYGGALHNDIAPASDRAAWSFGPDLSAKVGGRYVEVDIFVREFIQDTESWRKLEWYPHFDRAVHVDEAILFHPRASSYVLIFPRTVPR